MQEKPDLQDEHIIVCLQEEYGLSIREVVFLPLGADINTAVYRVETEEGEAYFLKLRGGEFNEAAVSVPRYLSDLGMRQIIPSLRTQSGSLWGRVATFRVILYPYVEGRHGFEKKLTPGQWNEFGAALREFHSAEIPPALTQGTPREDFSPRWREAVRVFLERVRDETFEEPSAAAMAAFLNTKLNETLALVARAEELAGELQRQPPETILCHGDIHGWNLLIDSHERLFLVDWDTLIFAPRERDLMFIGAGLADSGYSPQEEEAMFFKGYGRTQINPTALAYYRFERIIEDIAAFCDQIFSSDEGGEDRKQAVDYLQFNYLPGNTIDQAWQSYRALK